MVTFHQFDLWGVTPIFDQNVFQPVILIILFNTTLLTWCTSVAKLSAVEGGSEGKVEKINVMHENSVFCVIVKILKAKNA